MAYHTTQIYNGRLYVSGARDVDVDDADTEDPKVVLNYLGRWDGTVGGGWTMFNDSIPTPGQYASGHRLVSATEIYAYGKFRQIGSGETALVHDVNFSIARWNGVRWNALGSLGETNGDVLSMCKDCTRGKIYVVGAFTTIYGVGASRLAQFDIKTKVWRSIGNVAGLYVYSCEIDLDGNLYIGGLFENIEGDPTLNTLCKWTRTTETWTPLGNFAKLGTITARIHVLKYDPIDHRIVVGGIFDNVNGVRHIAQLDLDTGQWSSVGPQTTSYNFVTDLVIDQTGGVYYTGMKTTAYVPRTVGARTLTESPYSFTPEIPSGSGNWFISIDVDNHGIVYGITQRRMIYILRPGSTVWTRIGSLTEKLSIGNLVRLLECPTDQKPSHWCIICDSLKEIGTILSGFVQK